MAASGLTSFTVRKLTPEDDRSRFVSGNIELDRFFTLYAGQHQFRHHIGTTYVAVDDDGGIAGYATIVASELSPDSLPAARGKRLPRHAAVPVLRLARLAVAVTVKGQGIGGLLLRYVFAVAARLAEDVGCVGVVVDAKVESVEFHERLGFVPLAVVAGELGDRPRPLPMFLELPKRPT
jgi:GNAT superfamily N-acetyltransferase